jgi:arabinofuranosyltransferase
MSLATRAATRLPLIVAMSIVGILVSVGCWQASLLIDGTRYFWLDDDQMISMRYAYNLVDGTGLVWNAHERVEGYSNFLWTIVMAGAHLLPVPTAKMAVVIKGLELVLACLVLYASLRVVRRLWPQHALRISWWLLPILALSIDLTMWASLGFETTLLSALFLLALGSLLERPALRSGAVLLMALLPIVRADAIIWWSVLALVAMMGATRHKRTVGLLCLSLLPALGHLAFRWHYYGDLVPNTYYLRVDGVDQRLWRGVVYAGRFASHYCLALLACAWLLRRSGGAARRIALGLSLPFSYAVWVGGDMFAYSRYFAPALPLVLGGAIAAMHLQSRPWLRKWGCPAIALTLLLQVGVVTPLRLRMLSGFNGEPYKGVVAGVLIGRHTPPEASIAAISVGCVGYFGQRITIDLLGKTDKAVAKLPAIPGQSLGLNKFDFNFSFAKHPDVVVSFWPEVWMRQPPPYMAVDPLFMSFRGNSILRKDYLEYPVYRQVQPIPFAHLETTSLVLYRQRGDEVSASRWPAPELH